MIDANERAEIMKFFQALETTMVLLGAESLVQGCIAMCAEEESPDWDCLTDDLNHWNSIKGGNGMIDAACKVQVELERASRALRVEADPMRWAELYSVQQALQWVLDENIAKQPVDVVLSGRVQVPTDIPLETGGCLNSPCLIAS